MDLAYSRRGHRSMLAICAALFCACLLLLVDAHCLPDRPGRAGRAQELARLATPFFVIAQIYALRVFGRTGRGMLHKRPAIRVQASGLAVDLLWGVKQVTWPQIQSIRLICKQVGRHGVQVLEIRRVGAPPLSIVGSWLAHDPDHLKSWIDDVARRAGSSAAQWRRSAYHAVPTAG